MININRKPEYHTITYASSSSALQGTRLVPDLLGLVFLPEPDEVKEVGNLLALRPSSS